MATLAEKKKAIEEWKEHCKQIAALTDTSLMAPEGKSEKEARIHRLQQNYAAFCEYYFPHFLQLKDKTTGFNPHTHEGCDCIFSKWLNIKMQR